MKRVCGFAVSHIVTHYYGTSHRVAWSVGLSVTLVIPAKTAETDQVAICIPDTVGRNEPMRSRGQYGNGKGQFWVGKRQTIVKRRDTPWSSVQTAEPIDLPFRLWTQVSRRMRRFNRIRQVAPVYPHGRTRCRHLLNNIEPSVYGGDVPYVKLLWPHIIFGHAHLDSSIDSQALRAECCIVRIPHNTAI